MESEQFSKIFSFAAPEGATQFFDGAPAKVCRQKTAQNLYFARLRLTPVVCRSLPQGAEAHGGNVNGAKIRNTLKSE